MGEATLQLAKDGRQESAKDTDAPQMAHAAVAVLQPTEAPCTTPPAADSSGQRVDFFANLLKDAERMLAYSAEAGIEVDSAIRSAIIKATLADKWDEETVEHVLDAMARLNGQLKPVTPESLRDCEQKLDQQVMRTYKWLAFILAILIVPYSIATFVTSAISDAIQKDIVTANALAIKLTDELNVFEPPQKGGLPARTDIDQPPASRLAALNDLQQLAATARALDRRAFILNYFVVGAIPDPFSKIRRNPDQMHDEFEVKLPLGSLQIVAAKRITLYQRARYFASTAEEAVSFFYGALGSCILPVLYAGLGACAFLLRSFEQQVKARTFTFNDAHAAHLITAAIGGGVVGLFSNLTFTQTASASPFAIAFLVGYSVEVFFSSLERFFPSLNRGPGAAAAQPRSPGAADKL